MNLCHSLRVLCVSPRFPPSSAADAQRLRLVLPHFAAEAMEAEVLAVEPACCCDPNDPWQLRRLPPRLAVHRVPGLSLRWSRLPGLGSLESRTVFRLAARGDQLLEQARQVGQPFDLAYFSTTAFGCFGLGRRWWQRYRLPFVLDYQDAWVNDFYRLRPDLPPPGGRLKHAVVDHLQRRQEPRVLRFAAGVTSVSEAYLEDLRSRYNFAARLPGLVLPFPGCPGDFNDPMVSAELPFDPSDGLLHWVSIGRGGDDLATALHGLFGALAHQAPSSLRGRLRLHFIGTSYAPAGRAQCSIRPLALQYGLGDVVQEYPTRLPMGQALAVMCAADALLAMGSDDPAYTASKLYPYLLARRPLLAVLHQRSPACALLQRCGGAQLVSFDPAAPAGQLEQAIATQWLDHDGHAQVVPLDQEAFSPHTARAQAGQLRRFFDHCLQARCAA